MSTAPADAAIHELLRTAIEKAGKPLKGTDFKKALPKLYHSLLTPALFDEVEASGRIFGYRKGKTVFYGLKALPALTQEAILEDATDEPKTWTELKKAPKIKAVAAVQTAKEVDAAREALIVAGKLYEWPKGKAKGSAFRYGRSRAKAGPLLAESKAFNDAKMKFQKVLDDVTKSLKRAGVTTADVERAAFAILMGDDPAPEEETPAPAPAPTPAPPAMNHDPARLRAMVLDGMAGEDPSALTGAPVSIRNLRRALAGLLPGEGEFDAALLTLAGEGVVSLHRHDHPEVLSEADRAEYVSDGDGNYFIAISRRA